MPYVEPTVPFGNMDNLRHMSTSLGQQVRILYEQMKTQGHKYGGYYVIMKPVFLPIHPDIIKPILAKDFTHFTDKDFYINPKQPISEMLFFIGGERWRLLRQKITPTFTSGKMKIMFSTLVDCCEPFHKKISECADGHLELDVKDCAARFTTDIIGNVAFGIECNSFDSPNAEFRKYGKKMFSVTPWRFAKGFFQFIFKDLSLKLGLLPFDKDLGEFFVNVCRQTVDYRKTNHIERNDFMNLLINILSEKGVVGADEGQITFEELTGQAFVFFIAGFETSSTTMTFCMLELAKHQDIQDRVREEIHSVIKKHDGKITYDAINEMTYLKQVIDETLRKYPPVPTIDRKCTRDYEIPETGVTIKAGTAVSISTLGLHRDPEYFPDPDVFDPDRFSKANEPNIRPFTYIPFGEGPRICIGLRFGIMQTKIGLITLLKDFRYRLNAKTSPEIEIDLNFVLTAKGDILLDVERI